MGDDRVRLDLEQHTRIDQAAHLISTQHTARA
jgi:hypothetical protein